MDWSTIFAGLLDPSFKKSTDTNLSLKPKLIGNPVDK